MGEKILVIDDEPLILKTIETALGRVGYDIKTTSDVHIFRDILSREGADLVIMDMYMKGINASKLMAEVGQTSPTSKVLVMSGSMPGPGDMEFLQKPFKIAELRQRVKSILSGAGE